MSKALRDMTDEQVARLTDEQLQERMDAAHEKRQRYQRSTNRNARRYSAIWSQALREKNSRTEISADNRNLSLAW